MPESDVFFDAGRSPAIGGQPGALFMEYRRRALLVGVDDGVARPPFGTLRLIDERGYRVTFDERGLRVHSDIEA